MDQNSSGSVATGLIFVHPWSFLFVRSRSIHQLLMNCPAGKFPFDQRLQPMGCGADLCILTARKFLNVKGTEILDFFFLEQISCA